MRTAIIAAGWLWGLVALPQVTDAAIDFMTGVMLVGTGLAIGLAWLVYSGVVPGVFRVPRVRWLWLSVPLLGIISLTLSSTDDDLSARVWLCDSQLREYAEATRKEPPSQAAPSRRIGLFTVRGVDADANQVLLHTADGFMTSSGIVYRPDGTRPEYHNPHGSCQFEHLYGPWWRFYELQD